MCDSLVELVESKICVNCPAGRAPWKMGAVPERGDYNKEREGGADSVVGVGGRAAGVKNQ
jgi:hypothetical protein